MSFSSIFDQPDVFQLALGAQYHFYLINYCILQYLYFGKLYYVLLLFTIISSTIFFYSAKAILVATQTTSQDKVIKYLIYLNTVE